MVAPRTPPSVIHHPPTVHWAPTMCQARCRVGQGCSDLQGCMFATGVHQIWVGQGGLHTQRKAWSLNPTLHPLYLFPAPARVQCWVQLGSTFDLRLAFSAQVAQTQGPKAQHDQGHPYRLSVLPSSGHLGSAVWGWGPRPDKRCTLECMSWSAPSQWAPSCYLAAAAGSD